MITPSSIPQIGKLKGHKAEELLSMYRISSEQLSIIRGYSVAAQPKIEASLDHFYNWMAEHPDLMSFFDSEDALAHVRHMQGLYWKRFMLADVNEEYLADRRRIGAVHARIGLPVMFYMAGVSMVYNELIEMGKELVSQDAEA